MLHLQLGSLIIVIIITRACVVESFLPIAWWVCRTKKESIGWMISDLMSNRSPVRRSI